MYRAQAPLTPLLPGSSLLAPAPVLAVAPRHALALWPGQSTRLRGNLCPHPGRRTEGQAPKHRLTAFAWDRQMNELGR